MVAKQFAVLCCLAAVCLAGAAQAQESAETDGRDPADVRRAVLQLGADTYKEREEAIERVLALGPPAIPALKRAVQSDDPELAFRAKETLEMFSFGFTAETPDHVRNLAREALSSSRHEIGEALANADAPGQRVRKYLLWCHNTFVGGWDDDIELLRNPDNLSVEQIRRTLPYAAMLAASGRLDGYVGRCIVAGRLDEAAAEAEVWYALCPRPRTALLAARLHWAAERKKKAAAWAVRALVTDAPEKTRTHPKTDRKSTRLNSSHYS